MHGSENLPKIEYYFSVISPYTYLAGERLSAIAARHAAEIVYRPVDIVALFGRTGGVVPKERHISRRDYRLQELTRQARKNGVPINLQPAHWPTNQAPASYAFIAAKNNGGGQLDKLVQAFTRACWAEERNIADDAVIRDCLTDAGFDPDLANGGLLQGAEEYAANLEAAVDAGVFGAPFYIVDGDQRFWGQDRLDDLDAHLSGSL